MATLRNKQKLVAVTREIQKEHPRNGQSRNTSLPRIDDENVTQVFEEIEGRVIKKLPGVQADRVLHLSTLSKLDEILLKPQIPTHSGTFPGTSRNMNIENQEPTVYRSPFPE